MSFFTSLWSLALFTLFSLSSCAPLQTREAMPRQLGSDKLVFAHFMMGIVSNRESSADYDADMARAKAAGIDAFALNIGTDDYTDKQLGFAYESAATHDMKVFISFDFNYWSTAEGAQVGQKIAQYADHPGQLKVDGKVFASSFVGDGLDVAAVRSGAGQEIYFAPNFRPGFGTDLRPVDAALSWMAWDSDGNNRAPTAGRNVTVPDADEVYKSSLGSNDYIAPVSPWFFTHFGASSGYPKNWVFPSDLLWFERWNDILTLNARFLEILTWNDYGESHYIGPLSSKHTDDGSSAWTNDMPHDGWLDMAKPFIAAWKSGSNDLASNIESEQLIYWYRTTSKTQPCNDALGQPDGADHMADSVFVVTLLKSDAEVTISSGDNSQTFQAKAGAFAFTVPMGLGKQTFSVARNGASVDGLSGASSRDIVDYHEGDIYNFNAYVGTLPAANGQTWQDTNMSTMLG
ncbi:uncharacterized protein HMPREF1541_06908 [Cyphellophora europaea CBS 101466]|uniref:Mutanase n=1 Tax=Cyphellophora europaea (strain CBS 101466) TaxID=1220924 RepID=W2RR01_CYPE1|nr:uncharacterized protein HMPREF1541_06908 [Cyphellophora europaea CBS 101466]ETN38867.1 hypothetical protein HMPREF1541_06908 [Cyphellophora europaea CBS 101466]